MSKVIVDTETGEIIEKKHRRAVFHRWAQLNMEPVAAKKRRSLYLKSGVAAAVLDLIVERLNSYGSCKLSYSDIVKELGVARSSAVNAIKLLKDENLISAKASPDGKNVYCINPSIAWASYRENSKHSRYDSEEKIIRLDLKRDEALEN